MNTKLSAVLAVLLIFISGCDYFENSDTLNVSKFEASINSLPAIPDTMTFVGWFQWENKATLQKLAEKVFVLDADQSGSINYNSEKPLQSLQRAELFYLTIERKSVANDSALLPSPQKILSGSFSYSSSNLSIGENTGNFDNIDGFFNLTTPTNGVNTDELSGLWFVDSLSASPVSGLKKLPELYGGWIYEGWIEINGQLVSTGRFSDTKKADLFSGYSGSSAGFNFPGEDLLNNAPSGLTFPTNLSNAKVYVSIEYNDGKTNGSTPFIVVLEGSIPAAAQSNVSYNLNRSNKALTSGYSLMTVDLVK
jgi:hypothetical protein